MIISGTCIQCPGMCNGSLKKASNQVDKKHDIAQSAPIGGAIVTLDGPRGFAYLSHMRAIQHASQSVKVR